MSDKRQGEARYEIVLTEALAPQRIAAVAQKAARATQASPERLRALLERGPGTLARTDSATQAESVARAFRDAGAEVVARPPRAVEPSAAPPDPDSDTDTDVDGPDENVSLEKQARRPQPSSRPDSPRQKEGSLTRPSPADRPQSSDRPQPQQQPQRRSSQPPTAKARADLDASSAPDGPSERTAKREERQEGRAARVSPRASQQSSKRASQPSPGRSAPSSRPSSSTKARPNETKPRRAAPTSASSTQGSWRNTLLVAFLCLVIGVTGGYVAGSNADALDRLLSGAVATLLGQNDPTAPTSQPAPTDVVTTEMRRDYLADEIDLSEIEARYDASLRATPVALVSGSVTNLGSRRVAVLFVTAYFLGPGEQVVAEETYPAVLSSAFTTSREGPLLPGETRLFSFTADDVPGRWQEGEVRVEATDIDFE